VEVGISFIGKERELSIHEKREEFHISRERSMGVGSRAKNGRLVPILISLKPHHLSRAF